MSSSKLGPVTHGPATDEMRAGFAQALTDALKQSPMKRTEIAEVLEVTADAVSRWARLGEAPPPLTVFGLEKLLALPAGDLSRHLGYLPASSPGSVTAAIEADGALSALARDMLVGAYKQAVRH